MNTKKFLQQVYSKIKERENLNAELRDDCIEILDSDKVVFKIDGKGNMFYSADKHLSETVDKFQDIIQPIVYDVDEYLSVMENSPDLKARDFDMPYKKLAEFNGVVLGGTEHSNGSFEFTTWSYGDNALYHGHYFQNYEQAKEDFAVRANLVPESKIFTAKELMQIYRCTEDTLNNRYELTDEQTEILEAVQEKVKQSVPNFNEKLCNELDRECEQDFGQLI